MAYCSSDIVLWRNGPRFTSLVQELQVMACFLTVPSHYLNQCWLLIGESSFVCRVFVQIVAIPKPSEGSLNIKIPSYWYNNFYYENTMVSSTQTVLSSYWLSQTGKTVFIFKQRLFVSEDVLLSNMISVILPARDAFSGANELMYLGPAEPHPSCYWGVHPQTSFFKLVSIIT